eukprot:1139865-Pelagomonas_calceolata.AAC.2
MMASLPCIDEHYERRFWPFGDAMLDALHIGVWEPARNRPCTPLLRELNAFMGICVSCMLAWACACVYREMRACTCGCKQVCLDAWAKAGMRMPAWGFGLALCPKAKK